MVHLHCRDLNGRLTPDLSLLEETLRYIRAESDIVVEVSTGGVSNLTIEERVQPCYSSLVECTSLNVGSVNLGDAVYENPIKDVRYCVQQILENKKVPETELFELGMANTLRELDEQFHFPKPMLIALVFGYTEAHRTGWDMVKTALDMGASSLRLGFEDSDYLNPECRVDNNAVLIAQAADLVKSRGMMPMTPSEARELLGLPPLKR